MAEKHSIRVITSWRMLKPTKSVMHMYESHVEHILMQTLQEYRIMRIV